jgi:hypothetical protein
MKLETLAKIIRDQVELNNTYTVGKAEHEHQEAALLAVAQNIGIERMLQVKSFTWNEYQKWMMSCGL